MKRKKSGALTPEQAKERFRAVAGNMGPAAWIREKPRQSLAIALLAGMMAGNVTRSNEELANNFISMLLKLPR